MSGIAALVVLVVVLLALLAGAVLWAVANEKLLREAEDRCFFHAEDLRVVRDELLRARTRIRDLEARLVDGDGCGLALRGRDGGGKGR